jgi:hypothetical protein
MLRNAQPIAIRILKPRHLRSIRRRPDAQIILISSRHPLKLEAGLGEPPHGPRDVANFPSENCVLGGRHSVDDARPKHAAVMRENQRKSIISDECQAKRVRIEGTSAFRIADKDKGYDEGFVRQRLVVLIGSGIELVSLDFVVVKAY